MRGAAIAALVLASACASSPPRGAPRLELEERWRPLLAVVEDPRIEPDVRVTATEGSYCYVASLARWEQEYPAGSVQRDAILAHEQVHAERAAANPLYALRYMTSSSFRWAEERRGYRVQLLELVRAGFAIDVDGLARFLAGPVYSGMVSEDDARAWVEGVIAESR